MYNLHLLEVTPLWNLSGTRCDRFTVCPKLCPLLEAKGVRLRPGSNLHLQAYHSSQTRVCISTRCSSDLFVHTFQASLMSFQWRAVLNIQGRWEHVLVRACEGSSFAISDENTQSVYLFWKRRPALACTNSLCVSTVSGDQQCFSLSGGHWQKDVALGSSEGLAAPSGKEPREGDPGAGCALACEVPSCQGWGRRAGPGLGHQQAPGTARNATHPGTTGLWGDPVGS